MSTRWAIIVEGESPDAYGPYRTPEAAQKIADEWNAKADPDEYARVVSLKIGPIT